MSSGKCRPFYLGLNVLNKHCHKEIGRLATRRFLCFWRVRILSVIMLHNNSRVVWIQSTWILRYMFVYMQLLFGNPWLYWTHFRYDGFAPETPVCSRREKMIDILHMTSLTNGMSLMECFIKRVIYPKFAKSRSLCILQVRFVSCHDDVIKWKHFPRYWPFVRGIHRSPDTKASDAELWCFLWSEPE